MQARVTAIIVARNGASHLERTLEALRRQTRQPDTVIAVDCGSSDTTSELLAAFGPTHLISADSALSFGAAISAATRVMSPPDGDHELLWLLAQDSAPAPGALESLVGAWRSPHPWLWPDPRSWSGSPTTTSTTSASR